MHLPDSMVWQRQLDRQQGKQPCHYPNLQLADSPSRTQLSTSLTVTASLVREKVLLSPVVHRYPTMLST